MWTNGIITPELESELDRVLVALGMDTLGGRACGWMRETILMAVADPDGWQDIYAERIGEREHITSERVRQILWKTAATHWSRSGGDILSEILGAPVKTSFEYVKPTGVEFISMISYRLRAKHNA